MVGAIIQARMGSTRLPGKVLKELSGFPLLWHVVERLKSTKLVNKIIIATTTNPEDDALEEFANYYNILVYRGSAFDVLARFLGAAQAFEVDTVVRICADSPLIDPFTIDELLRLQKKEKADVVSIEASKTSLLDGFEVLTTRSLEWMDSQKLKAYHREHVSVYAKEHPEKSKVVYYNPPKDLCHTDIRITVDTQEDFDFMQEVYNWLYDKDKLIDVRRLDKLPFSLFRLNASIRQKPANARTIHVQIISPGVDDDLKEIKTILENSSRVKVDFHKSPPLSPSKNPVLTLQKISSKKG